MAIASSGALAISDISSEFGGSGARSLSDYYAGDGLVASLLTDSSEVSDPLYAIQIILPTRRQVKRII